MKSSRLWKMMWSSCRRTTWWTTRFWWAFRTILTIWKRDVNFRSRRRTLRCLQIFRTSSPSTLTRVRCRFCANASKAAATSSWVAVVAISTMWVSLTIFRTTTLIRRLSTSSSTRFCKKEQEFLLCLHPTTPTASCASCVITSSLTRNRGLGRQKATSESTSRVPLVNKIESEERFYLQSKKD